MIVQRRLGVEVVVDKKVFRIAFLHLITELSQLETFKDDVSDQGKCSLIYCCIGPILPAP